MAQTHLPPNWRERLCAALNVHGWLAGEFPLQVMRLLDAWQRAEGGSATWNPLNSTNHVHDDAGPWQAAVDYNSVGVCNYRSPVEGIQATVATLLNGNYSLLVGALQGARESGKTAEQIVREHRTELQRWGTNPTTILSVLARSL